jgi:hypothetical protein
MLAFVFLRFVFSADVRIFSHVVNEYSLIFTVFSGGVED